MDDEGDDHGVNASEQKSNVKSVEKTTKSKVSGAEDGKSMLSKKEVVLDDF